MRTDLEANRARIVVGLDIVVLVSAFLFIVPPIAREGTFHLSADARVFWGIPNFWNVVSNLPSADVGSRGLWRRRSEADRALFAGVLLTAFGSVYYHPAE